jgi:hypothetical protein
MSLFHSILPVRRNKCPCWNYLNNNSIECVFPPFTTTGAREFAVRRGACTAKVRKTHSGAFVVCFSQMRTAVICAEKGSWLCAFLSRAWWTPFPCAKVDARQTFSVRSQLIYWPLSCPFNCTCINMCKFYVVNLILFSQVKEFMVERLWVEFG